MSELYIGLMSGTSMDGIDAALVAFGDRTIDSLITHEHDYPAGIRDRLSTAMHRPGVRSFADVAELHRDVGACFRDATQALLAKAQVDAGEVTAIGSHGQTIRHEPSAPEPFSLQIGDANLIARETGIVTVADFRSADIAAGGQGAPLAPAFHNWLLRDARSTRVIVNIGGIANITVLPADAESPVIGFDTGPGNTLLDVWCRQHRNEAFDRDGAWSLTGRTDDALLTRMLADTYFHTPAPKSTGFEYFNADWLAAAGVDEIDPADVQATLVALTAASIAAAIRDAASPNSDIFVCGGGAHNAALMSELQRRLPAARIAATTAVGLDADWVEAAAFAWLAKRHLEGLPGNLPSVTGATKAVTLGTLFTP